MAKKSKTTAVSVTDSTSNQIRVCRRACNSLKGRVEVMKTDLKVALGQTVRMEKKDPDSGVVIADVLSAMNVPLTLEGAKNYLASTDGVLGKRAKDTFEFWTQQAAEKKAAAATAPAAAKRGPGRPKKVAAVAPVVTPTLRVVTGKPGRPKKLENMTLEELEAALAAKLAAEAAAANPEEARRQELIRKLAGG